MGAEVAPLRALLRLCSVRGVDRRPLRADWTAVGALARRHGMGPLLHRRLRAWRDAPPDALRLFAREAPLAALRSRAMLAQLGRVVDALAGAGVPVLVHKGPAIAAQAYGDVLLRASKDLDVVVAEAHLGRARERLLGLGFMPVGDDAHPFHRAYLHPSGVELELHWALAAPAFPFDLALAPHLAAPTLVPADGRELPTFDPETQLLVLAAHAASHAFASAGWIADIAYLRVRHPPDEARLLARADALGCGRLTRVALVLAADAFGAPLACPQRMRTRAAAALARSVARAWASSAPPSSEAFALCRIAARERPRDALAALGAELRPGERHLVGRPWHERVRRRLLYPLERSARLLRRRAGA